MGAIIIASTELCLVHAEMMDKISMLMFLWLSLYSHCWMTKDFHVGAVGPFLAGERRFLLIVAAFVTMKSLKM